MKKEEEWKNWVKWRYDLLQGVISWAIIGALSYILLHTYQDKQAENQFKLQKTLEFRINSIRIFRKNSLVYLYALHDVFYNKEVPGETDYHTFTDKIVDEFWDDMAGLRSCYVGPDTLKNLYEFDYQADTLFTKHVERHGKAWITPSDAETKIFEASYQRLKVLQDKIIGQADSINTAGIYSDTVRRMHTLKR
ncbi:hypothetical protein [Mucilaginibacter ginsenosidivorans]|uniref:Uncharacterized protein n=1 Tax=Mucilaginibacter ginsenosidivorans TaxID=398053 RepID=A0A5B8UUA2_9SPHI|nr:hypothetical protein [Mucilaginibacter ginsenosidivorans]QEC62513.1 hypothetical protein FRZ54_07895 [Mucilaginibacter ginsenosidivorans]